MTQFFAKKLNKKGFTLAELLIVVAIIAVLVAIALPIFTGALEKARLGVHRSNARSLKSQGVALILGDPKFEEVTTGSQKWIVAASYDFSTEKYDNYAVVPISDFVAGADSGEYYMTTLKNAVHIGSTSKVPTVNNTIMKNGLNDGWGKFGDTKADDLIGKTKTSGSTPVYYAAVITEQDLTNAGIKIAT